MERRIKSIKDLYPIIEEIRWARFGSNHMEYYRGHEQRSYKLLPGLCRNDVEFAVLKEKERLLFDDFVQLSQERVINEVHIPFNGDYRNHELRNLWYIYIQAQHLGLKTRLMDWSLDPFTSLIFIVDDDQYYGIDGSLWVYFCPRGFIYNYPDMESITRQHPLEIDRNAMINHPLHLPEDGDTNYAGERRVMRQSGRFWIQPLEQSIISLDEQKNIVPHLMELIIDGDSKANIKEELIETHPDLEWLYFRRDENVSDVIKSLNQQYLI